jgi:hypothetical protein
MMVSYYTLFSHIDINKYYILGAHKGSGSYGLVREGTYILINYA